MSCPLGERSRCVWSEAFPWWQTEFYSKETIRDVWVFLAIQLREGERQTTHTHTHGEGEWFYRSLEETAQI